MFGNSTPFAPIVQAVGPEDLYTGTNAGTWASLADYDCAQIYIALGTPVGGTIAITLDQATDIAGTGSKTLSFTKYYSKGQKLLIDTIVGTFSVGETLTGSSSGNTAKVIKISSAHLILGIISGSTTWTDNEVLTGGTSGATAAANGTGTDEDMWVEYTATSDTFNTLAVTFTDYMIPIDASMLDVTNGFDCFQVDVAKAASGSTVGGAFYVMKGGRYQVYPLQSSIGAFKTV